MSTIEQSNGLPLEMSSVTNILTNTSLKATSKANRSGLFKQLLRGGCDLSLIYSSFLTAYLLRFSLLNFDEATTRYIPVSFEEYLIIGLFYTAIMFGILLFKNFYNPVFPSHRRLSQELLLIGNASLSSTALITLGVLQTQSNSLISRLVFIYLIPITFSILGAERVLVWYVRRWRCQQGIGMRKIVVVGATDSGMRLMRAVTRQVGLGYHLVGFVDDKLRYPDWHIPVRYGDSIKRTNKEVPHLGNTTQLNTLLKQHTVDEVIIALPSSDYSVIDRVIEQCRAQNIPFTLTPALIGATSEAISIRQINGISLIETRRVSLSRLSYFSKRLTDIAGSFVLITLALIPMLIIALAIRLNSHGPALFRQTRVGKGGKTFTCYKFRSMYIDAESRIAELENYNETKGITFKMKNDPRITKVGRFIRRTSLDELPQLFNVLLGQMSLVGPRPGLPREVSRYENWHLRRLEVMPGLTGLWQVNGRSSIPFEEMVKLDIYYVEHWSLTLDLKILFKTFQTVIEGDGAH